MGDTHGHFYDVLHIIDTYGYPSEKLFYVFNGDFVDRGSWGVEISITVFILKILCPSFVFLTRGNHETSSCSRFYGFYEEVRAKYGGKLFSSFQATFAHLPIATLVVPKGECMYFYSSLIPLLLIVSCLVHTLLVVVDVVVGVVAPPYSSFLFSRLTCSLPYRHTRSIEEAGRPRNRYLCHPWRTVSTLSLTCHYLVALYSCVFCSQLAFCCYPIANSFFFLFFSPFFVQS